MSDDREYQSLRKSVLSWVRENRREDSRLEYKKRIEFQTQAAKAEFIRDVIALANSEGESPREDGHLIIGFKNGDLTGIRSEDYDGATIGQIVDGYVVPQLDVAFHEFVRRDNTKLGVLVIRPRSKDLYLVRKRLVDERGKVLLYPGQSWCRRADRKCEMSGEELSSRFDEICQEQIAAATAGLRARIGALEQQSGPALEIKRIRFEMEATADWDVLEQSLQKLPPYIREFGQTIKGDVLDATTEVTVRTRRGMPVSTARAVQAVLLETMPLHLGGLVVPSQVEITEDDVNVLERIEHQAFNLTWDACRYVRNTEVVAIGADLYFSLIRYAALNKLDALKQKSVANAKYCASMCDEARRGNQFPEGKAILEREIAEALDIGDLETPVRRTAYLGA